MVAAIVAAVLTLSATGPAGPTGRSLPGIDPGVAVAAAARRSAGRLDPSAPGASACATATSSAGCQPQTRLGYHPATGRVRFLSGSPEASPREGPGRRRWPVRARSGWPRHVRAPAASSTATEDSSALPQPAGSCERSRLVATPCRCRPVSPPRPAHGSAHARRRARSASPCASTRSAPACPSWAARSPCRSPIVARSSPRPARCCRRVARVATRPRLGASGRGAHRGDVVGAPGRPHSLGGQHPLRGPGHLRPAPDGRRRQRPDSGSPGVADRCPAARERAPGGPGAARGRGCPRRAGADVHRAPLPRGPLRLRQPEPARPAAPLRSAVRASRGPGGHGRRRRGRRLPADGVAGRVPRRPLRARRAGRPGCRG